MMTRLGDERSKRGVGDGTHLPVSFRQERARPKEAVLKATASPSKPRKRADECTLREPVTARKQRTFQTPHVDSLLLHPIATPRQKSLVSPSKPAAPPAEAFRARQSPVRKAQPTHNLSITARHTESADDDHETSDAYNPAEDDGDSDVSEVSFSFGTSTASKPARSKQLSLKPFLLPRRPLQVVEPTSVTLNAQPQSMASPKKGSFLEAGRPGSSSDAEPQATIRFSPPTSRRPLQKQPRAEQRLRTPSPSPPPSPSKSRLTSPSKKLNRVPPTPHRPSIDAFWDPDLVNAWNDEYSPRKILMSPRKKLEDVSSDDDAFHTPTTSPKNSRPQKRSPTKRDRAKLEAKKTFEKNKHAIADDFITELGSKVDKGEIQRMLESSGGIKIIWSRKLNSTAGRANWKREGNKSRNDDGEIILSYKHIASIELAEKVIDDETRLLNVLAHEYCHLLNFMISNVRDQPHGTSFKRWAAQVTSLFADRGVEVTTKHSYVIDYKYAWTCSNDDCATEYERHSRSIDPARHTCGKCKGRLEQIRPAPRGGKSAADGTVKKESEYQKFVKDQFSVVRKELEAGNGEKSPMKDVMREVAARYRSKKAMKDNNVASPQKRELEIVEIADSEEDGEPEELDDALDSVSRKLDFLTLRSEE